MTEGIGRERALSPYRVLDLTQGGALMCGKMLADLGADVIKIERPGGDPTRNIGPFYKDIVHPEKSLFWFAYNVNKRGITLNIETADGQAIFKRLVKTADFVVESFTPGYLDSLGLGYPALEQINPGVILTSITPFGQTGPKSGYPWCDLTNWASCGALYVTGDADRPPVAMGFPVQITLGAASEATVGALIAHYQRESTGQGQHVDISMQEANIQLLQNIVEFWDMARYIFRRVGNQWLTGHGVGRRMIYDCKDGYCVYMVAGGGSQTLTGRAGGLLQWMQEEGMLPDWLQNFDWVNELDATRVTQETMTRVEQPFADFFRTKTKKELWEEGWRRGAMIAVVKDMKELTEDPQLEARQFWAKLDHPELGDTLTYCGPFAKLSATPLTLHRRPPLIGEHNEEIYIQELGLSKEELALLKSSGSI